MPAAIRFADANGTSIAYEVISDGDVDLVVIGGMATHLEILHADANSAHLLRRLAAFSRLIVFDRSGVGCSDPVAVVPALEDRVAEILAVMDAAGSRRCVLLGISEGAALAAYFAATQPERVSKLVMWVAIVTGRQTPERPWGIRPLAFAMLRTSLERWGEGLTIDFTAPSHASSNTQRRMWGTFERLLSGPGMMRALARSLEELDVSSILPSIAVPTLVIGRTDDALVPIEQTRYIAESIPNAELHESAGPDHLCWLGPVDDECDAIERFVSGSVHHSQPDRALMTLLFTDIVDSTARLEELGDSAWRELASAHDELVRRAIDVYDGREIKTMGDGFLVTFDGPASAVRCALDICDSVRALGLEVRAGLHTGDVDVVGQDVAGLAVNIAARVVALAGPGQVLVTATVSDLIAPFSGLITSRGAHRLKGVSTEHEIFCVESLDPVPVDPARPVTLLDRAVFRVARHTPSLSRMSTRLLDPRSREERRKSKAAS